MESSREKSISRHRKIVSSKIFTNFAFTIGLYISWHKRSYCKVFLPVSCFYREKELTLSARNAKKRKYSKRVFNHPTSTTMKKVAKQHINHYRATLQKKRRRGGFCACCRVFISAWGGGCPRNHSSDSCSSTSSAANHIPKTLPASPQ